jgi:hypothetical protein
MKNIMIVLILLLLVGVGASSFTGWGILGHSFASSPQPVTTLQAYSYPRDTAGGLIEGVNASSGRLDGCNILATSTSNDGYSLTLYLSSQSPSSSESLCVTAVFHDDSGVPLTYAEGADLGVRIDIRNSDGAIVDSGICVPSLPPPPSNQTGSSSAPQGLQCAVLWDTEAPANGAIPAPGSYQVSATGFLLNRENPSSTSVNVSTTAGVNLVSG